MSEFPPYQGVPQQPHPQPARAGSWPKSLGVPSMVVVVGLISTIVTAVIGLGIQIYGRSADTALGLVHPTLILVTLILTGIAFITWLYRARVNLYYFGMYDLRWKSAWTIWAWFIPIVNIVIPLLVVNEVDRASETRAGGRSSGDPSGRSSGRSSVRDVFMLWAISWTGFLLLDRFTSVSTPSIVDLSARNLDRFTDLSALSTVLQIAAAVFAIRLVRRVTANQELVLTAPPAAPYTQPGPNAQASPHTHQSPYAPSAYAPSPQAQSPQAQSPYSQHPHGQSPDAQNAHAPSPHAQVAFPPEPYQPPAASQSPASPPPEPPDSLRPPSDPWPSAGF
jgi:hypothetical protein